MEEEAPIEQKGVLSQGHRDNDRGPPFKQYSKGRWIRAVATKMVDMSSGHGSKEMTVILVMEGKSK